MLEHFRLLPFIAGIVGGIIVLYVYIPEKTIIRQYPHPSEAETKTFRDPNGICYKYTSHEVDCDKNESTLKDYPIQG